MAKTKVAVLGGGMVGGFMAKTLALDAAWDVTLFDRDPAALARTAARAPLATQAADLSDPAAVRAAVAPADLVVGAVPGFLGHRTVRTVLEAGKNIVDISFFPEEPWDLAPLAEKNGLLAIVDCGVMPGLGGMLGAYMAKQLDQARALRILVGGLPVERRWPFEYKAPFSPIDVIEEYTRPARLRRNGETVVRPALSDPELIDFPGVGTLEAFNTDGLRSILRTIDLPDMAEKTLRYPGHIERMRMFRDLGFFGTEPVEAGGVRVRPLDLTAKLLFADWKLEHGMPELTAMRVEVDGTKGGRAVTLRADLLDRTDPQTGDSSMARTTGLPAVLAAGLFAAGAITRRGLVCGEELGFDAPVFERLLEGLARAGVPVQFS